MTAITILTFGTSQIDLFASKVGSFINYVALCFSKVLLLHLHFDLFCLIILFFFFFSTRSQQSATLRRTVRLEMWSRQTRSEFFSGFFNSHVILSLTLDSIFNLTNVTFSLASLGSLLLSTGRGWQTFTKNHKNLSWERVGKIFFYEKSQVDPSMGFVVPSDSISFMVSCYE